MSDAPPQRLYLHVGLPKSGSTYLQSVLGSHRAVLKAQGYVYPYVRQEGMFHAALEMSGNPERWGISAEEVSGTFARLLRRGREFGGTVVVSHEIFGAATPRQVEALREQLADFDVHVVVTVRNLGRMLSAQWQERVKNGYDESFQDFAADVLADLPDDLDGPMAGFWRGQNLAWLLDRFAPLAPPERTHIVVTPPGAAGPEELWRRFAEAIELPADVIDLTDVPRGNESLGAAQIAFLRDVLGALDGRLTQPWFHVVFKRWFAQSLLGTVRSRKPVTPSSVSEPLEAVARAWIDRITTGGYRVHGDLEELLPDTAPAGTPHPDEVSPAEKLEGLPQVVAEMLLRNRDLRARVRELETAQAELVEERDELAQELEARSRRWWRS